MNNNTFVSSLADICYNEGINFDIDNNHVRCLAHVMNIAVQHALKSLKATAANNEDEVLNIDDNDVNGFHTIMKVNLKTIFISVNCALGILIIFNIMIF